MYTRQRTREVMTMALKEITNVEELLKLKSVPYLTVKASIDIGPLMSIWVEVPKSRIFEEVEKNVDINEELDMVLYDSAKKELLLGMA